MVRVNNLSICITIVSNLGVVRPFCARNVSIMISGFESILNSVFSIVYTDEDVAKQDEWHKLLADKKAERAKVTEMKEKLVDDQDGGVQIGVSDAAGKDGKGEVEPTKKTVSLGA